MLLELEQQLKARGYAVDRVAMENADVLHDLQTPARKPTYFVAIGSRAAEIAVEHPSVPTAVLVPPNMAALESDNAVSVPALPPLELQLRAWKQLDPSLRRVGLLLGRGQHELAAEARRAAAAVSISLVIQRASSDQEALYLLKRLLPAVDGLWLLPDNAILSPRAVKEMLDHANHRRVQTLVFTPSLLEWGALASVTTTPASLAWMLAEAIDALAAGKRDPTFLQSLSELEVMVNEGAAKALNIDPPAARWLVRYD
jgi:ABC-type uncharacterized transport system substrate-binding protein